MTTKLPDGWDALASAKGGLEQAAELEMSSMIPVERRITESGRAVETAQAVALIGILEELRGIRHELKRMRKNDDYDHGVSR